MAGLDASIILQGKAPQIENPLAVMLHREQLQGAQSQNRLLDAKLQEQQRTLSDNNALRDLTRNSVDPTTGTLDPSKFRAGLAQSGNYDALTSFDTKQLAQQKSQAEAKKAQIEGHLQMFDVVGRVLSGVKDQTGYDAARAQLAEVYPDQAAKMPPVFNPQELEANRMKALPIKDQLEQQYKALTFGEMQRHNQATEGNSAGQLGVARERLAFDQNAPRGQVVQTDQGTMLVDPRSGQSRPVTDSNGQPVQKPGREIPASVNKSIIENQQSISKIDQAIAAIQARPGSVGTINMIPGAETVRQYTDPEGIEARAGVADVGSLILHDRSGAAVTASETPRLKPFIPSASDRPEVAIKKLQRFKELYQQEAGLLADTYSKSQGYRDSPVLSGQKTASKSAKPSLADIFGN